MFSSRSAAGASWRRLVFASGLTAALVLVPGVAAGDEGDDPLAPGTGIVEQLEGGGEVPDQTAEAGGDDVGGDDAGGDDAGGETDPPPENAQLRELLNQLAAGGGFSEECADGVATAIELIGRGLTTPPATPEEIVTRIEDAVTSLTEGEPPTQQDLEAFLAELEAITDPENSDVTRGLELLATTLAEECQPAPPAPPAPLAPPAPPASGEDGHEQPAHKTQEHPAPQPVAQQPVTYPGYAPTGAESDADEMVPLVTAGALLLIGAGGAVWARRRWRAAQNVG